MPTRVKNYQLPVIRSDWKGNLLDPCDRFVNETHPFVPKFQDVLRWTFQQNPQRTEKRHDSFRLTVKHDLSFLSESSDCIVWLGHASFFIRLSGVVIITDPVFYDLPFVKRFSPHALSPKELGRVDYLLISHDHRDHCQKQSIRELVQQNPQIEVLTGLKMDTLLKPWVPKTKMQCAGWYQQFRTRPSLAVCFLPARHWGKRGSNDTNMRLWGACMIQSANHTIYFGADTGYDAHFAEAAKMFPGISIAILGVGAYKPSWFMEPNHMSPDEAVRACNELAAKTMIPMHYATFDLSDEPPGEAVRMLEASKSQGILQADLQLLNPGEIFRI